MSVLDDYHNAVSARMKKEAQPVQYPPFDCSSCGEYMNDADLEPYKERTSHLPWDTRHKITTPKESMMSQKCRNRQQASSPSEEQIIY